MRELTDLPEAVIGDLVVLKLNAVGLRGVENLMPSELSRRYVAPLPSRVRLRSTLKSCCTTSLSRPRPDFTGRHRPPHQPRQQSLLHQRNGNARHRKSLEIVDQVIFSWHTAKSCSPDRPKKCANSTRLGYASLSAVWQTAPSPTAIRRKRL